MQSDMLFNNASMTPTYESVDSLVSDLTVATSQVTSNNRTHFPSDLNTTNTVVANVLDYLTTSASGTGLNSILPLHEVRQLHNQVGAFIQAP